MMSLLWKITARNWMDRPTERQHRVTGKRQHIEYSRTWTRADGPKPQAEISMTTTESLPHHTQARHFNDVLEKVKSND
ncbi:hypothetical protein FG476_03625 [Xylella fastidiosa subsp. multiplex]|uniref:Uncharacterized protein n=2 Tax=Xylella fastidiosa TaxID=2371 RepID=A0A9Q4QRQ2_XYLFS|nr:conserved hypothetical protein [Xylella fastidiosa M12]MBE0268843.1 hypothetical protein [Xylella fastidiosa subsp. multiplex]MBE0276064.1 hypothetical protein [Xylella fastidiosa subsp. multiplex]MBE0277729.1 hypothetical protein [Xylella fastidiosa subsp. multiplex]MBE0282318.1 hypothetical protein [Xylella fastidiosa subsp. multiplex]